MTKPEERSIQIEVDAYFQGYYDARKARGEALVAREEATYWQRAAKDMENRVCWLAAATALEFAVIVCGAFYIITHQFLTFNP